MSGDLILYTNPMSRGRIVRWMLEEAGASYETRVLDYGTTMKAPDYLKINPMGKVPAIVHKGVVVTETAAICAYLADVFPDAGLAPAIGDPRRGAYYRWLFYAAGPYEASFGDKAMGVEVPADKRAMVGYGCFADVMNTVEAALAQGPYILGESFSAADVYLGSQIGFGLQFGMTEARPAFTAYWQRLIARPAHVRATALDDALMPKSA